MAYHWSAFMNESETNTNAPAPTAVRNGHWFRVCIFFLTGGFVCANVFVEGLTYTPLAAIQNPPSGT